MITINQSIADSAFIFQAISETSKYSKALEQDGEVKFLGYAKLYDDGSFNNLLTAKDWCKHYLAHYLKPENSHCRLNPGINYWKRNTNQNISEITEDARNNFDIDARIEFVYRDEKQKCYHMYSFYSNRKNADKSYRFYDMHRAKLLKFIAYFNRSAAHLIAEADKPENRIQIPQYEAPIINDTHRDYMAELKAENASCSLTDREFEILILYASGCTANQIAEMFHRSLNTIITHISSIHKKTNCSDKRSLRRYMMDRGWDGLEKFFFSYIPESSAVH